MSLQRVETLFKKFTNKIVYKDNFEHRIRTTLKSLNYRIISKILKIKLNQMNL